MAIAIPISSRVRPIRRPGRWTVRSGVSAAAFLAPLVSACGGDGLSPPGLIEQDRLYWELTLNHHAAAMSTTAPYDTLTVVAIPRNLRGERLNGLPAPEYVSRDVEHVLVTPDGVVHAVSPTTGLVPVVVTVKAFNIRHLDSIFVQVVDDPAPPVLDSLSVQPIPPDSAKTAPGQVRVIPLRMVDLNGAALTGIPVAYSSSDITVANIDPTRGQISGYRPGTVTFYASTSAFGVARADTLQYRIGWQISEFQYVSRQSLFHPEFKLGVGGYMAWILDDTIPVDVTFADPTNVMAMNPAPAFFVNSFLYHPICEIFSLCDAAGDFVLRPSFPQNWALRRFPVPGTYDYHSTALGASGRIVVVDEQ